MWPNLNRASPISRHILSVTDSVSVGPLLAAAVVPEKCCRKCHEFGASGARISSASVNGSKTLLIGVGGNNDTDDIEESDVDGEADLDLPRVTGTKGSSGSSSKSPLLPSSELSSSGSSTASIDKSAFSKWTAFRPPHLVEKGRRSGTHILKRTQTLKWGTCRCLVYVHRRRRQGASLQGFRNRFYNVSSALRLRSWI